MIGTTLRHYRIESALGSGGLAANAFVVTNTSAAMAALSSAGASCRASLINVVTEVLSSSSR